MNGGSFSGNHDAMSQNERGGSEGTDTIRSSNTIFHGQQMSSRKLLNLVLASAKKLPSLPPYCTSPSFSFFLSIYMHTHIHTHTEWPTSIYGC